MDFAEVDKLYEVSDGQLQWALYDKRLLMPASMLPDAVAGEGGPRMTVEDLRARAATGWFTFLPGAGMNGDEDGVPLCVPSRVVLLSKLEAEGWTADELRQIAAHEQWLIDEILTTEDWTYIDDDLQQIITVMRAKAESIEHCTTSQTEEERQSELRHVREELVFLERLERDGVTDRMKPVIAKAAFRTRAWNDIFRTHMLKMDRDQVLAGYSPYVQLRHHGWNSESGFYAKGIEWGSTVRAAVAEHDVAEVPIRVPGFVLVGERVTPTRTLRPAEYTRLWKEHDLDDYLREWASVRGERRCLNCLTPLPSDGSPARRFCSDRCRSAAKMRRHRERNPDSVDRATKKYWESLEV
jgi:predicted nucleic acid-binding Zn ribbon protein